MIGILIVFHADAANPRSVAKTAEALGRGLVVDIRLRHSIYSQRSPRTDSLRKAAHRLIPGARRQSMLIMPFTASQRLSSPVGESPSSQNGHGFEIIPKIAQLRELLSAALANSHACQNWLAESPPNLDRARLSIAKVTRELGLVAEFV